VAGHNLACVRHEHGIRKPEALDRGCDLLDRFLEWVARYANRAAAL
jgi:hypothetical protein